MFTQIRILIAVASLLAVVGAGAWAYMSGRGAGWASRDGECKVQLAEIENRAAEAERQGQALREKGRALADRLAAQALEYERRIAANAAKFRTEIDRRARADRVALDSALVRMLNSATPIRETVNGETVPAAPDVARADAAATADRDRLVGASERSVARWIVGAQEMYEQCRGRLHALQAWARDVTQ